MTLIFGQTLLLRFLDLLYINDCNGLNTFTCYTAELSFSMLFGMKSYSEILYQ